MNKAIKLFENKKVRVKWNSEQEKWYFSIIDVIEILTGSSIPRRYWSNLKIKLKKEGFELYEKIVQLKLVSSDGKRYGTDCADTELLLRIIQSIPSPKAEPFKVWLAKVGYQRIEDTEYPELAFERAMKTHLQKLLKIGLRKGLVKKLLLQKMPNRFNVRVCMKKYFSVPELCPTLIQWMAGSRQEAAEYNDGILYNAYIGEDENVAADIKQLKHLQRKLHALIRNLQAAIKIARAA